MVPRNDVMDWLSENVGPWTFDWTAPQSSLISKTEHGAGGNFYFKSEEDRLLFCLAWLSEDKDTGLFWHPV
jgi:hypothetical protein